MSTVAGDAPLSELAHSWLDWKNTSKPSPNTLKARRADLVALGHLLVASPVELHGDRDQLHQILGSLTPADLHRDAVVAAFAAYADTHAAASIRRARSTWHGFCKWMIVHRDVLDRNPIDFIEAPANPKWRPKPISEDDLAAVIAAAQTPSPTARNPWPELEQALCAIFVGAGVRVGEAVALRAGDIRRSPTEIAKLNVTGKGDKTRTVPLPPEVVTIIDTYLADRTNRFGKIRNTHPLFVRISGEPLTTKVIDYVVTGWFRRAGITPPKGALGHSLRHTYATLLIEQGGSVPELQRLLGHADMSTTQAYIDVAAAGIEQTAMANPARALLAPPSD